MSCRWDAQAGTYLVDGEKCRLCEVLDVRLAKHYQERQEWECWVWHGARNTEGYAVTTIHYKQFRVHRVMYERYRGTIPVDMVIDHLCRNRACVNPAHLEPVSTATNVRRGISPPAVNARRTACIHGHPFTPENTRMDRGKRYCLECKRRSTRISNRKRRAKERQS